VIEMLIEPQARRCPREQTGERGLAHFQRVRTQVIAIQFDQIEGIQEGAGVTAAIADAVE